CSDIDTSENSQNKVAVSNLSVRTDIPPEYSGCVTIVSPKKFDGQTTFCEIELLTGKKHQIRAHLQAIGHPLVGDQKYFTAKSQKFSDEHGIRTYMLHCAQIELPEYGEFIAPLPNWSM
ncbi:MAG: RNA pseudouridine synthase, partial [Spirochaetales bacterium]|nr:RNA pseudouridine synthase [Spirochaetales bacterium]